MITDAREIIVTGGTLAFAPRGAVHSFTNTGASTAGLLSWTVPGDNEPYFRAVSEMGEKIDPERFAEINKQFATEFVGA